MDRSSSTPVSSGNGLGLVCDALHSGVNVPPAGSRAPKPRPAFRVTQTFHNPVTGVLLTNAQVERPD